MTALGTHAQFKVVSTRDTTAQSPKHMPAARHERAEPMLRCKVCVRVTLTPQAQRNQITRLSHMQCHRTPSTPMRNIALQGGVI